MVQGPVISVASSDYYSDQVNETPHLGGGWITFSLLKSRRVQRRKKKKKKRRLLHPPLHPPLLYYQAGRMVSLVPLTRVASIPGAEPSAGRRRARPRFRVCGRVKDEKERVIRVSDPLRRTGLFPLLSGPLLPGASSSLPSPSPTQQQQRDGDEDKQNYYVNVGYAIRTLREDFPDIFQREPRFDIYRFVASSWSFRFF